MQFRLLGRALGPLLLLVGTAHAATITALTPSETPGTTWEESPELRGKIIDRKVQSFSFNPREELKGTVESLVVRERERGTLDFYWRISVAPDSFNGTAKLAIGLGNYFSLAQAGWLREGMDGAVGPVPLEWQGSRFDFGSEGVDGLRPGTTTAYMFIRTDATNYDSVGSYVVGSTFQNVAGLQESNSRTYMTFAPVPEPEMYVTLAVGLALSVALARRRGKSNMPEIRQIP